MAQRSAVIFLTDDTAKTGYPRPLMLQCILGRPMLSWLAAQLAAGGCERFFLAAKEPLLEAARACFPADAKVTFSSGADTSDQLHVFLSTADDEDTDVLVIAAPVMRLPASAAPDFGKPPAASGAYSVNRRAFMDAIDYHDGFQSFLGEKGKPLTDRDGFYPLTDVSDLAAWQPVLRRDVLARLAKNGVEIWDYDNCYVDADVFVGSGTVLMPGTILRGNTVIGRNCKIGPNSYLENTKVDDGTTVNASQLYDSIVGYETTVGPFAYVRPNTVIGNHCRVGDFVELKNSTVGDGTKVSHLTYVGDSDVGKNVNFGCGTVTVNYDRAKKHRTLIGDNCFIGCNSNLVAPVTLGNGAYTAAGSTITDDVPEDALAIARARQVVKKDWAKTNKVKK